MMSEEKETIRVEIVKKPWYKRWWAITIFGLISLSIISSLSSQGESKKESTTEPVAQQAEAPSQTADVETKSHKVGEAVQVGEVKWTVVKAPEKVKELGNEYSKETANGIFLVIELSAELTGKESGTIDSNQLEVIDSQDRKFKSSTEAQMGLAVIDKEGLFLKQVNPNVPVTGFAAFDIPEDATGLKLEVKDLRMLSDQKALIDLGM